MRMAPRLRAWLRCEVQARRSRQGWQRCVRQLGRQLAALDVVKSSMADIKEGTFIGDRDTIRYNLAITGSRGVP
jgi:hypothetical protein